MYSWNGHQRSFAITFVRTGESLIGRTPAGRAEGCCDRGVGISEAGSLFQQAGAFDPDREVLVAQVEPDVDAQSA